MRPFCVRMPESRWNNLSPLELIEKDLCPAWVLPSTAVLGRCLPKLMETGNANNDPNSTVIGKNQTPNGKTIDEGTLTNAVTALGAFLQLR